MFTSALFRHINNAERLCKENTRRPRTTLLQNKQDSAPLKYRVIKKQVQSSKVFDGPMRTVRVFIFCSLSPTKSGISFKIEMIIE
jgi:hypothetical protein